MHVRDALDVARERRKRDQNDDLGVATLGAGFLAARDRGFELSDYDAEDPPTPETADLVLYLLARESMMCSPGASIDWAGLHGGPRQGMRRVWHDVPTVMVSFGHPGYLLDAPRVPVYINAYYAANDVQLAVLRKLLGEEDFLGISPIDAFCGQEEAHW